MTQSPARATSALARSATRRSRLRGSPGCSTSSLSFTWTESHAIDYRMRKLSLLLLLVLVSLPTASWAADSIPSPDVDAAAWAKLLYTAVTSHSWGVVTGLVLIAVVYPLRRFGPDLFKSKFGGLFLAFFVSLCATLGAAFAAGAKVDVGLIVGALTTAATAAGLWEWLKAHVPGVDSAAAAASVAVSQ